MSVNVFVIGLGKDRELIQKRYNFVLKSFPHAIITVPVGTLPPQILNPSCKEKPAYEIWQPAKGNFAERLKYIRRQEFRATVLFIDNNIGPWQYLMSLLVFVVVKADVKKMYCDESGNNIRSASLSTLFCATMRMATYPKWIILAELARPYIVLRNMIRNRHCHVVIPSKILIIRLDGMGDVIMMSALLGPIKRTYPDSKIDLLLRPESADLFAVDNRVSNVHTYIHSWHDKNSKGFFSFGNMEQLKKIRENNYDVIIESRGSYMESLLAFMLGAKMIVSPVGDNYYNELPFDNRFLISHPVESLPLTPYHGVRRQLLVAKRLGCCVLPEDGPKILFSKKDTQTVTSLLKNEGLLQAQKIICIHTGAAEECRRLPSSHYVEIIKRVLPLANEYGIILTGTECDCIRNRNIIEAVGREGNPHIVNWAGKLTPIELASLYAMSCLVISNDTGPMHLAYAVDSPLVALFLHQHKERHAPVRSNVAICLPPKEIDAIEAIPVDDIMNSAIKLLRL